MVPISIVAVFFCVTDGGVYVDVFDVFCGSTVVASELVIGFCCSCFSPACNQRIALFCSLRRANILWSDCFGF
jgi:hypothetical protein